MKYYLFVRLFQKYLINAYSVGYPLLVVAISTSHYYQEFKPMSVGNRNMIYNEVQWLAVLK